jgi:hypothetical protein
VRRHRFTVPGPRVHFGAHGRVGACR